NRRAVDGDARNTVIIRIDYVLPCHGRLSGTGATSGLEAEAARDDVLLDLGCAFTDNVDQRIAMDPAHRILGHDAGATIDADRLLADGQGRFTCRQFHTRGRG